MARKNQRGSRPQARKKGWPTSSSFTLISTTRTPDVTHCVGGKKGFTEAVAEAKLRSYQTSNRPDKPVRTYLCPLCDAWHLTSREATR